MYIYKHVCSTQKNMCIITTDKEIHVATTTKALYNSHGGLETDVCSGLGSQIRAHH